ncbi:MAG: two-component regulator propeller domain-containing protein [Steroidobacteraceae bacterium]
MRRQLSHRLCGSVLAVLLAMSARAAPPMVFQHLAAEEGLSQNSVMSISQDGLGFIWLATEDGLNRYDGYEVLRYGRERSSRDGLGSNFIWATTTDSHGSLWVAAKDGGLARWDPRAEHWLAFRHDPTRADSLPSDASRHVYIDRRGQLWVATTGAGLSVADAHDGKFRHFRHDPQDPGSLASDTVTAIVEDQQGQIWIGTDAGLNRYRPASENFLRFVHDPADPGSLSSDNVSAVYVDRAGNLWVGTYDAGLNRLGEDGKHFRRFAAGDSATDLLHDEIRALLEDSSGRFWIGTAGGLNLLDRESGEFARYVNDPADATTLRDNYVMSLFEDRSGLIWVGTRGGGVSRWNPRSWSFGHRRPGWAHGVYVMAFARDQRGNLWVGSMGGSAMRRDERTGKWASLENLIPRAAPRDRRVMSLASDTRGSLWIGTMTEGLVRVAADGKLTRYSSEAVAERRLSADGIMSILPARDGRVWVGSFGGGVNLIDANGKVAAIRHGEDDTARELADLRATALAEDRSGRIWVGTEGFGLYLLDGDGKLLRNFRPDPADPHSLSAATIYSLHVDHDGTVWVGTAGGGLDQVVGSASRPTQVTFRNYEQVEGLASNVVYGIQTDDNGNLWLSGPKGLARFTPTSGEVRQFHRQHGLQAEEFNFGASFRSADGRLYFGGANGFNEFDPAHIEEGAVAPLIALTRVEVGNRPVADTSLNGLGHGIDLGFRDNTVAFEVTALDYVSPAKNRYAYRLIGFDDDWNELGSGRRITYTNLDAGHYKLEIKAASADGLWSLAPLAVELRVAPAPWLSRWAYFAYTMLLLAAVALWQRQHRLKLHHAAEEAAHLEQEVRLRTQQLSERNVELERLSQAKSEFLARMSHEIRTPMNGVIGMTELLTRTELNPKQSELAAAAKSSAMSLMYILDDILDLSKAESGGMQLESMPFDLSAVMFEAVEMLSSKAEAKGLEIVTSPPPELEHWLLGDPLRLRQVLLNLLGNAIKFTSWGDILLCAVVTDRQDDRVELAITVRDTGIGMAPEVVARIFDPFAQGDESTTRRFGGTGLGLAICKELVTAMAGEITAESKPAVGSTFTIKLGLPCVPAPPGSRCEEFHDQRVSIVSANETLRNALMRQCRGWQMQVDCRGTLAELRALNRAATAEDRNAAGFIVIDADSCNSELSSMLELGVFDDPGLKVLILASATAQLSARYDSRLPRARLLSKPARPELLRRAFIALREAVPIGGAPAMEHAVVARPAKSAQSLRGRVLVAEDNEINQSVIHGMLGSIGCIATMVANGADAVSAVAETRFDLALMDLQMPEMDGLAATRAIRAAERGERHLPIIALTANAAESHRRACLHAGMDDFLSKPVTLDELRAVLARWLPVEEKSMSSSPVTPAKLNEAALNAIRSLETPGEPSLLARVARIFVNESGQQITRIRAAIERRDLKQLAAECHALKSSAASLGADSLARAAAALEQVDKSVDPQLLENLARQLWLAHSAAVPAIAELTLADTA